MKVIKILLCMSLFYVGYSEAACTGTMNADLEAIADRDTCTNLGIITPSNIGISSSSNNVALNNLGVINLTTGLKGIVIVGSSSSSVNSGSINGSGDSIWGIWYGGDLNSINNSGAISLKNGRSSNVGIESWGSNSSINNSGTIDVTGGFGIELDGWDRTKPTTIINSGSILGSSSGIINRNYTIDINNYKTGVIESSNDAGIDNQSGGVIRTLINQGNIRGDTGSISNQGIIEQLDNLQNDLIIAGHLPDKYNIIINNSTYGKMAGMPASSPLVGPMVFGISNISTATNSMIGVRLTNVLTIIGRSNLYGGSSLSAAGDFITVTSTNGYSGQLIWDGGSSWDLILMTIGSNGPSAADTQASLSTQARRLRSTFNSTMASGNFANMNTYDCNLFDKNNMCISAGGRYTSIDNPSSNNSAAVVVLGYKVNSNIRIGGFLDQSINNNTPTGINISNKNPMMGAFAVWNQNADGLGYQVKIANAYQDKDVRSTRDAFGETGEAGTGKTNLNTQSYVGELSYAFQYQDSTIVRPYFALRYTNIKQDAYTETGVDHPLSYAKLGDRSTTALMGVKLNHTLTPRTNLTASLGVEQDINHQVDKLTATGVADLTSENFNNNIKRTRPVASAGAYYAVAKNQRLSGEVYYQQLPFQSTGSATAYFNYMIGF